MFKNREEAGRLLVEKLRAYENSEAVVLALPRGGVVVGAEVAKGLSLPLDIIVGRKVGHPDNEEYALCAVNRAGFFVCNDEEVARIDSDWLREAIEKERREAERREEVYREGRERQSLEGRTAIIVDDGIATGLTMRLVVTTALGIGAKKVVVAVPAAPAEIVAQLKADGAGEVIILDPDFRGAVGAHYEEFEQVSDKEVINLMSYTY